MWSAVSLTTPAKDVIIELKIYYFTALEALKRKISKNVCAYVKFQYDIDTTKKVCV
jgi:hypothetical protein